MLGKYILIGQTPVPEPDLMTWAKSMDGNRVVEQTEIEGYLVSTIFLGLDHSFGDLGPPLLFETMIFKKGSFHDLYCERCSTWLEAEEQHKKAIEHVKTEMIKR